MGNASPVTGPIVTPTDRGPFELKDNAGGVVGTVSISPGGAAMSFITTGPFGREDLRTIAHRLPTSTRA
jgi:hypothetical protein